MPPRRRTSGNPFRGVLDVVSEMNRMSERMTSADPSAVQQPRGHSDSWSPVTDILADGAHLMIHCELPGVATEDVEVSFSRGTLTISGTRHRGKYNDDDFYVQERAYGQFRRDITLPEGVRQEHIHAKFSEGLLQVTVLDSANASGPAQINVHSR